MQGDPKWEIVKNRKSFSPDSGKNIVRTDSSSGPVEMDARMSSGSSRFSSYKNLQGLSKGRKLKYASLRSTGGPDVDIPKPLRSEIESTNPGMKTRALVGEIKSKRKGMRSVRSFDNKSLASENEMVWLTANFLLKQAEAEAREVTGFCEA